MNVKATKFIGGVPIRTGVFVGAFCQFLMGLFLWISLGYLRPQLHVLTIGLLSTFTVVALIGFAGAYMKSEVLIWTYLVLSIGCTFLLFMITLEFLGVCHFIPKPPKTPSGNTSATLAPFVGSHFRTSMGRHFEVLEPDLLHLASQNETEGESEEVSEAELPPEYKELPSDMQKEVTANLKGIKHLAKIAIGVICSIFVVFCVYLHWIAATYALNKCTSMDEYIDQPNQFEPMTESEFDLG